MPFATAEQLKTAEQSYRQRGDTARAETCASMAAKADRLTDKANAYALDLIALADKPVERKPSGPSNGPSKLVKLFFNGGKLAQLDFGIIGISLKNDGTVAWIKYGDKLAGCVDPTGVKVFASRLSAQEAVEVRALLAAIEDDPMKAAVEHGRATGRCCVCSRLLTNPESIDAGIGPICSGRLG